MSQNIKQIIAKRLKEARVNAGFSQEEVRIKMGYKSTGTISQHENGTKTPQAKELAMLANTYNVSIGWLYGEEDEPNSTSVIEDKKNNFPLTPEEQELIKKYRHLNESDKATLDALIARFIGGRAKHTNANTA